MYSISRKKVIKKKWKYQDFDQIKNLDGFLMPSRGNKFRIHEMVVKDILVVDVMLAKGLVRDYVDYLVNKKELNLKEFNIYDIIIEILKEKGFLDKVFEYEKTKGTKYVNNIIVKTLGISSNSDLVVDYIKKNIEVFRHPSYNQDRTGSLWLPEKGNTLNAV